METIKITVNKSEIPLARLYGRETWSLLCREIAEYAN